ncbi:MAG TPA: LuxR C-terminal-related transcriptional regulator [Actinomycetales bacterium]
MGLSSQDATAVLALAAELTCLPGPDAVTECVLHHLPQLMGGDVFALNQFHLQRHRVDIRHTSERSDVVTALARLAATMDDHPLVQHYAAPGASPLPRRVSDVASRRSWLGCSAYNEVLRPMGTPHLLAIPVAARDDVLEGYAVTRSGRDFSARDVEVARALQVALVASRRATVRPTRDAPTLTPRELEVLTLLSTGCSATAIGHRLGISALTVRKHLENTYRKLGTSDRLTAVDLARRLGMLPGTREGRTWGYDVAGAAASTTGWAAPSRSSIAAAHASRSDAGTGRASQ